MSTSGVRREERSLQKRRLKADLVVDFQYLQGGYQEDGARLCTVMHVGKMRQLSKIETFGLDIRKSFYTMTMVKQWNRLRVAQRSGDMSFLSWL